MLFCSCRIRTSNEKQVSDNAITAELAYEGVYNYCHSVYDWSVAEDNPSLMSLTMGDGNESEFEVIFRSYTGSFVYFHVDKESGNTRMTEYVPALGIEEEAGSFDIFDYTDSQ